MNAAREESSAHDRLNALQSVNRARMYLQSLYTPEEIPNLRLEEIELDLDGRFWHITFGYTSPERERIEPGPLNPLGSVTVRTVRDYKVIDLDAETGQVRSMKIRDL